jgi:hypothetical protein
MAFVGKVLAEGQLATTKGTLYTVPALTTAYVKWFSLFNTNAAQQTIIIYIKPGATSRKIRRYVIAQNASVDVLQHGESIVLEAGDLIEAETTTATAVDYVITGVEEA